MSKTLPPTDALALACAAVDELRKMPAVITGEGIEVTWQAVPRSNPADKPFYAAYAHAAVCAMGWVE